MIPPRRAHAPLHASRPLPKSAKNRRHAVWRGCLCTPILRKRGAGSFFRKARFAPQARWPSARLDGKTCRRRAELQAGTKKRRSNRTKKRYVNRNRGQRFRPTNTFSKNDCSHPRQKPISPPTAQHKPHHSPTPAPHNSASPRTESSRSSQPEPPHSPLPDRHWPPPTPQPG